MVQISQVLGNICRGGAASRQVNLWFHNVWQRNPDVVYRDGDGLAAMRAAGAPLLELCHPQAALEAATQN